MERKREKGEEGQEIDRYMTDRQTNECRKDRGNENIMINHNPKTKK